MHASGITAYFDILSQSQKAYGRKMEPICKKWDMTRSEVDVLLFLYNNPAYDRAADIVTHRGMAKSHVSMSVASLVARNLLERLNSPEDRRTTHLRLLEAGKIIAAEAREAQLQFFEQIYGGISQEERNAMTAVIRKVHKNIETLSKTV